MYKDILRSLATGDLAQIGLIAFVVAFSLIVIYAFTLKKQAREDAKNLPLLDPDECTLSAL